MQPICGRKATNSPSTGAISSSWPANRSEYSIGFNISDYKSVITKYDNPDRSFAKDYYEGMEIGEIWGFKTDGFFKTDEEAKAYAKEVDLSSSSGRLTGGWMAGDLKFLDLDGDGIWGIGSNTVDDPGDRVILGQFASDTLLRFQRRLPLDGLRRFGLLPGVRATTTGIPAD